MLIQNLEQKTRLALFTVLLTVIGCTVICGICIFYCAKLVSEERSQIYVIDGDIPFLAERSKQEANFIMEAKALKAALDSHFGDPHSEHTVQPGMLYIPGCRWSEALRALSALSET